MMNEDRMLTEIALEQALAPLDEADRVMLLMVWEIEYPDDYTGPVPATYTAIGRYIGERFEGGKLSEAAIRYRRDQVLSYLRGERPPLRRVA